MVGACEDGQFPTASPTAPPVSPPTPPITVSFVEESKRVTEGETIEIQVAVSGHASESVRIQVIAEQDTVVDADYELLTPVLEIPPSGVAGRTTTITFRALEDVYFAEGDETLWLRLGTPEESDVEFGPRLAVTIDDVGVSPCSGIQLRAEPPAITDVARVRVRDGSSREIRSATTRFTVTSGSDAETVALYWIGPYRDFDLFFSPVFNAGRTAPLHVALLNWGLQMDGLTLRHEMDVEWLADETIGLRFRSASKVCIGEPIASCIGSGCELQR